MANPELPLQAGDTASLAVYIHWPFCVTKCPYCDFNSHVRAGVDTDQWQAALSHELAGEASRTPGKMVTSIFFGGGTPSLMPPALAAHMISEVHRHWPVAPDLEITLEANPSSVEAERFSAFADAGVNRVSLGLQALDDAALKVLGRPHDLAEGLAALALAQRSFARVSFDLIYARPDQTASQWEAELNRALGFGTSHLSLYQLTIEPRTRFAALHAAGKLDLPDEDAAVHQFEMTQALTADAGLPAYEISNHARPGQEARHNLSYWRYGDYIGIGPGAHGRRCGQASTRLAKPEAWLRSVAALGHGLEQESPLEPDTRFEEAFLMGLRLTAGIDLAELASRTGCIWTDRIDHERLAHNVALGLIRQSGSRIAATAQGRLLLNRLIEDLLR